MNSHPAEALLHSLGVLQSISDTHQTRVPPLTLQTWKWEVLSGELEVQNVVFGLRASILMAQGCESSFKFHVL